VIEALCVGALVAGMGAGLGCSIWVVVDVVSTACSKGKQTQGRAPKDDKDDTP
jgi:hypothetical protein